MVETNMSYQPSDECKKYIQEKLAVLKPALAKASVGDFSENVPIPSTSDEFTELYVGIQIILEVIRGKILDLEMVNKELSEAQEIARIGSWEWDAVSNRVAWSDELYRIHGLDPSKFKASYEGFLERVHFDMIRHIVEDPEKLRGPFHFYHNVTLPDNTIRILHVRGRGLIDEHGKIIKMTGTEQDVTAEKQAEEALQARTEELQRTLVELREERTTLAAEKAKDDAILASIGEGLVMMDKGGKIVFLNTAAEIMIYWKTAEVLGREWSQVVDPYDIDGNQVPHEDLPETQALATGRTVMFGMLAPLYLSRKDKTRLPVAVVASPVLVEGKTVGVVASFRDITKEWEIDRAKTELVSLASHELRTPLSAVHWYAEMLLKGETGTVTEAQRKYIDAIYQGTRRMAELVDDLLNVSRIELGTLTMTPQMVDPLSVMRAAVDEVKPQIETKALSLIEQYSGSLPKLRADPHFLYIVFQNLMANAVKYIPHGGTITVEISPARAGETKEGKRVEKDSIFVAVADTGYGIPLHQQERIFTKLFRADNVHTRDTEGAGLGLYITKAIVEYTGGMIWFRSPTMSSEQADEEHRGTTFYVILPLEGPSVSRKRIGG